MPTCCRCFKTRHHKQKKGPPKKLDSPFCYIYLLENYTTPCANIASATLTKPAILAPLT